MSYTLRKISLAFLLGTGFLIGLPVIQAVEFANIDIVDDPVDQILNPPTVSIPVGQGTLGFNIEPGAVTGLFPIRIGVSAADDAANGVLLGYVRETGRLQNDALGGMETLYATAANARVGTSYSLLTRRVGFTDALAPNPSPHPVHAAMNANLAAAYFPFSEGWQAGSVYNAINNGVLVELVGSPGLTLINNFQENFFGTGDHVLTLPGVTDTRRQGLLFVNGAKDEANYALSEPTADGSGFTITGHDNAKSGSGGERDPVSFVFMPLGTPNVTMARVFARGHGPNQDPVAMIQSGDAFTITRESAGEYRLSIPGQTPSSGTLLVSPSGANDGNNGNNSDNIVTYKAAGNDWIILAQDLSNTVELSGVGQESGDRAESYFSFAFMPFSTPVSAPGPVQAVSSLTNFNKSRVIGWNAQVTEVIGGDGTTGSPGNGKGDMFISEPQQTSDVNIVSLFENRGDNVFAVDGAFLAKTEGVMFATISQGFRNNSITGGLNGFGVLAVSQSRDDEWWVHTSSADPSLNGEMNVNFSTAFFGADTGFKIGQHVPTPLGTLEVLIPGEDALNDGALFVTVNAANQGNFVTATPKIDGTGWDISHFDADASVPAVESVNHIYLPYDTNNLVAGRVNANGTIASSTDLGGFTLVRAANGDYTLTVAGKTPSDGMLLLTSTGEGLGADNTLVYEPALNGTDFRILGLDMITGVEATGGAIVSLEDTSFMFAYIDFDLPPELSLNGDFDNDGDVDGGDFLLWQRGGSPNGATAGDLAVWESDYGTPPGISALAAVSSASAVPEPGTISLLFLAIAVGGMVRFPSSQRTHCK